MRVALLISTPLLATLLMSGCVTGQSSLTPKNVVQADIERLPRHPHYEYQSYCGKPCTPITVRWQLDGTYSVQHGGEPAVTGRMELATVNQLSALYDELRQLTLGLPNDLTRAAICQQYATDHAVKIFATPATVDGWRFKDNHGCSGFQQADALRRLETKIELALPVEATTRRAQ